jgi:hypothetical protein
MHIHTVQTDSKGRLNPGKDFASCLFLVDQTDRGEFTLKKAAVIPEKELWLYKNQETLSSVEKGIEQAKKGKI